MDPRHAASDMPDSLVNTKLLIMMWRQAGPRLQTGSTKLYVRMGLPSLVIFCLEHGVHQTIETRFPSMLKYVRIVQCPSC